MRTVMLRVAGLLLLLGLLAVPMSALAAPQITITPRQGPNSTLFVVTGVGFTANTTYYLRIVSQDGQTEINFDDASTKSDGDGVLLAGFSFGSAVPAGSYVASITTAASGGSVIASTNFALSGENGTPAGPDVVVTPSQGKGGDTFVLTGTGFAPNGTYSLRVQTEDRKTTISFNNSDLESDADGVILSGFSLSDQRPNGAYLVEVLSKAATPAVLASTTFSLSGAAASPSPSTSPSPSATPAPSASPSPTPAPSASPSPSPSATPAPSATPSPSPSASPSATPTPMPSASPMPPSPPPTGNGGYLPGLPNTGGGGMSGGNGGLFVGFALVVSTIFAVGVGLARRTA